MSQKKPADDPSSAPESGTVRNDTSGNQPAQGKSGETRASAEKKDKDDPSQDQAEG